MPPPPLSQQLRDARLRTSLSVAELARRSGTSRSAIHAYETGSVSPSLDTAQRILAAIGHVLTITTTDGRRGAEDAELARAERGHLREDGPDTTSPSGC